MIKLVEVCETSSASDNTNKRYSLREIYVNPKHVVSLRSEPKYRQKLHEGVLPEALDSRQEFTRLTLDKGNTGIEVVVVGDPNLVNGKLKGGKDVLKG